MNGGDTRERKREREKYYLLVAWGTQFPQYWINENINRRVSPKIIRKKEKSDVN